MSVNNYIYRIFKKFKIYDHEEQTPVRAHGSKTSVLLNLSFYTKTVWFCDLD